VIATDARLTGLCLAGVVGGAWLFWRGFRHLRFKRLMENTPTSHVRSMPMGLVEINGRAESRSTATGPFSGRACAYWEVDIAMRQGRDGWAVVHREQSGQPFYLRDATGVALVYPHGAEAHVRHGVSEECAGVALPECYATYMSDRRLAFWRVGTLRFRERAIEEGQPVYVLGTATPRARVLDVSAGEAMAATGTDNLRAERVRGIDHEVVATVRRGDSGHVFVISEESERALSASAGLQAFGGLIGGPLITLAALVFWMETLSRSVGHR
jgi:hypothetical protein